MDVEVGHTMTPTRDGTRLSANLFRPTEAYAPPQRTQRRRTPATRQETPLLGVGRPDAARLRRRRARLPSL